MTREEAIAYGTEWLKDEYLDAKDREFIKIALEVLKQEPCTDCVSRQAVLDQTYLWSKDEFLRDTNPFDYLRKRINSLPPVNPQKMGHWIYTGDYLTEGMLKCSECGEEIDVSESYYDFCPVCGVKMIEPQESEDRE